MSSIQSTVRWTVLLACLLVVVGWQGACGTSGGGGGAPAVTEQALDDETDDGSGGETGTDDPDAGAGTDSEAAEGDAGDSGDEEPADADPDDGESEEVERPDGWTEETHSKDADPDYDVVFASGQVLRLDITIASEDWQAMQDQMTEALGEFGAGGGPAPAVRPGVRQAPEGPPPEAIDACDGLEPGDDCVLPVADPAPPGACQEFPDGQLVCTPQDAPAPVPGDEPEGGFGSWDPLFVPSTVEFEGHTWRYVGIRYKGNSTLSNAWRQGVGKLPFRLDFDEFEDDYPEIDDQRCYGFKKLSLGSNSHDPSLLREKVSHDLFRAAGIPSPRTAFYRVYVDHGAGPVYFGLYTMTEVPDDPFLATMFGDDGGNLYKPEGGGASWKTFDEGSFEKQTNEDDEDWSDVEAAIEALHADHSDAATWRAGLEAVFNVDAFVHWLAVNTIIQNWDSYGITAQNYYVYGDPEDDGRLAWIPWDLNETLKDGSSGHQQALSLDFEEVDDAWPLIRNLMDDPVYWDLYVGYVQETIDGVFSEEPTQTQLQAEHDLIAPYVVGAEGEQPGYTFLASDDEFDEALNSILNHVTLRHEEVLEFLGDPPTPRPGPDSP